MTSIASVCRMGSYEYALIEVVVVRRVEQVICVKWPRAPIGHFYQCQMRRLLTRRVLVIK